MNKTVKEQPYFHPERQSEIVPRTPDISTHRTEGALDHIFAQAEAGDAAFSVLAAQLQEQLSELLVSPDMRPHLVAAANELRDELEALVDKEQLNFEEIHRVMAALREQTFAEATRSIHEQEQINQRTAAHDTIDAALLRQETATATLKERIHRSLDYIFNQYILDPGDTIVFAGYGATKDVFRLIRAESAESEAIALVYATGGHTIQDIMREVDISQRLAIDGVITYREMISLTANGTRAERSSEARMALVRTEYIEGYDAKEAARTLATDTYQAQLEVAAKESLLSAYQAEIETAYATIAADLETKYAIVLEEHIFAALIEQYGAVFEQLFAKTVPEIQSRLRAHIQRTLEKQQQLYAPKAHRTEAEIGKEILIRAIAARRLHTDVRARVDRLRVKSVVALTASLEQTAHALDTMHQTGYVHQDIKPDNIIGLSPDRAVTRPTIIDLGSIDHIGSSDTLMKGTKRYMEPELFGRSVIPVTEHGVSPRKDARAFVITLFDMLSDGLHMDRLTVFPPVVQDGKAVSGASIVEQDANIIQYYSDEVAESYAFLQYYLKHELHIPYELLSIFDRHEALEGGVVWEQSCASLHTSFQSWVSRLQSADIARMREVFAALAHPDIYMQLYTHYTQSTNTHV